MKKTILVIEDNDLNRKLVRDVLHAVGFEVVETVTAEEGLELAVRLRPALVIMDIQLPGMDGLKAIRELRRRSETAAIPVLSVTASAMETDRKKILDADFDGYLPKPINPRQFIAEVCRLVESGRAGTRLGAKGA